MNKQRKVLITITYNEMGIIIDTKAEEVAQPNLQPTCNQLATNLQPTIPPMPKSKKLRLIDILRKMDEDELAEWLCVQMWDDYREDLSLKAIRFHQVRNFLLMEVDNESLRSLS